MQTAYHTMVDGHQILVDYNRQQLMPGWIPRRLGNGVSYLEPKGMIWQMFQPRMCRIFLMLPIIFHWSYLFNPNQNINNNDWCLARQVEALVGRKNQGNSDLEVENVHSGHLCKFLFFQSPKPLLYLLLFS
jgi:hypothetical protein